MKTPRVACVLIALCILASCTGGVTGSSDILLPRAAQRNFAATPHSHRGQYLYVIVDTNIGMRNYAEGVSVYATGNDVPMRTFDVQNDGGHSGLGTVAVGPNGDVYVSKASTACKNNEIDVYAPGGTRLIRRIGSGFACNVGASGMAFGPDGSLYASVGYAPGSLGWLLHYAPDGKLLKKLPGLVNHRMVNGVEYPNFIVVTASGNAYTYNCCDDANNPNSWLSRYDANLSLQNMAQIGRLPAPKCGGAYMAVYADDVYLSYSCGTKNDLKPYVVAYENGSDKPFRTITDGLHVPNRMAFARNGDLYVVDGGYDSRHFEFKSGKVMVYAPGESKPKAELAKAQIPGYLAFADDGYLYVEGFGDEDVVGPSKTLVPAVSDINVYAPGATTPSKTVKVQACYPQKHGPPTCQKAVAGPMAFGPQ